jgi:hypothetical protein
VPVYTQKLAIPNRVVPEVARERGVLIIVEVREPKVDQVQLRGALERRREADVSWLDAVVDYPEVMQCLVSVYLRIDK